MLETSPRPSRTPRRTAAIVWLFAASWALACGGGGENAHVETAASPVRPKPPKLATPPTAAPPPTEVAPAEPACPDVGLELPDLISSSIDVPLPAVADEHGAMRSFHEKVLRLLRGRTRDPVRIAVFGDSNMTMDWITGEIRRTLQLAHGDAGHGYIALGRPWNWYRHMDVRSGHDRLDWKPFAVSTHPSQDRAYGFAGISARSERRGAVTWVATAAEGSPIGLTASRFDLYYLKKPHAGSVEVRADGQTLGTFSAESPDIEAGFYAFTLPDAAHRIEVVAGSMKPVTVFGMTLERDVPSFIVDSLGVGAVSGPLLLRQDPDVMRAALRHRGYDLVVLLLGSNQVWPVKYVSWMSELIARFRDASPNVSVLVTTPVDQVTSVRATHSVPDLRLVAQQNVTVARETQSAFWDFRGAMGGEASMVRFIATGMGQADGIHLTQKGARYMARRMLRAILEDTTRYLARHPRAGCEETPAKVGSSP